MEGARHWLEVCATLAQEAAEALRKGEATLALRSLAARGRALEQLRRAMSVTGAGTGAGPLAELRHTLQAALAADEELVGVARAQGHAFRRPHPLRQAYLTPGGVESVRWSA